MAKSTCAGCGVVFSSVSAFDQHRAGTYARPGSRKRAHGKRYCLTPIDMLARGMAQNERGWWTTGGMPQALIERRAQKVSA